MISLSDKKKLQRRLLTWFEKHARDLPWRRTRNPYAIWVSEIMLQQTQVATVIPYYERFLKAFPTVHHLAKSPVEKVLKMWEGLGYYSRARNLHQGAGKVVLNFQGKVPDTEKLLLDLPGIGRYTAGAILSIAYNKDAPILDGNVKRVLSRLFADSRGESENLWKLSGSLIPKGKAGSFNQALMDLGAMICTPKGPQCSLCPLAKDCRAKALGKPEQFPAKASRKTVPLVEAVSGVINHGGRFLLRQRPLQGLLGGLWEFPNWQIEDKVRFRVKSRLRDHIREELGLNVQVIESIGVFHHAFTHFKLVLHVFRCEAMDGRGKGNWKRISDFDKLAMPRIHRRIADSLKV